MAPTFGLRLHVTLVLAEPVTVVENCCVCAAPREAVAGVTVTLTAGFKVTRRGALGAVGHAGCCHGHALLAADRGERGVQARAPHL